MRLITAEFVSLRRTIAQRGTARAVLLPLVLAGWGGLAAALVLGSAAPAAFVLPLVVLGGGFEAIHALHTGAERIGRYLQVRYEADPRGPRWETTAMAVGPALPGGGVDPLFTLVFAAATAANLTVAFVRSTEIVLHGPSVAGLGLLHAVLIVRLVRARRAAARQRSSELARMSECLQPEIRRSDTRAPGTFAPK